MGFRVSTVWRRSQPCAISACEMRPTRPSSRRPRTADVVLVSKDSDFVDLVQRLGPPPRLVWVTIGNVSNAHLRSAIERAWPRVVDLLEAGEPIVELG